MGFLCVLLQVSLIVIKVFFFESISGKKQDKFYVSFEKHCKNDLWLGGRICANRLGKCSQAASAGACAEARLPSAAIAKAGGPQAECCAPPPPLTPAPGLGEALECGVQVLHENAHS